MHPGARRGASRARDSRQWLRRRRERRKEEQDRQTLATGEPRGSERHTPERPLAGERIAARKDASTWLAQSESSARDQERGATPTGSQLHSGLPPLGLAPPLLLLRRFSDKLRYLGIQWAAGFGGLERAATSASTIIAISCSNDTLGFQERTRLALLASPIR